ncbi:MAG: alginate lyase family protein [Proteobacteria bacterium]|nr:alginate lyase family protein [Pseudomonadota bacterium]
MSLSLLWNTARYLKPVQIYGRICYHFHQVHLPSLTTPSIRLLNNTFTPPIKKKESLISPTRFRFLNQEHEFAKASDWNNPAIDKLWLYNLHYFDYLNKKNDKKENELYWQIIERWIEENPAFAGNGWEPYPLSLRIVNWIKWLLSGNSPTKKMIDSLYLQAWYLRRRLEFHLLGNHLFANAKALVFAGLFFDGVEAEKWLNKGLQILAKEVPEQVLADGGHFERSPMYHAVILEDLLDLINIVKTYNQEPPPLWFDFVERMLSWLKAMCHPDGQISFFNDAALGIAPEPSEIEEYAGNLGLSAGESPREGATELRDSGYIRLQKGDAVLIVDVGKIGPDYLPGHAHADTLSFELSLKGGRVFVNSGTSCYGNSMERLSQRGTASHNTVMIDGKDSSEVWSGFRVARRARPFALKVNEGADDIRIACSHDGYRWLTGQPIHRRQWVLQKNELLIKDTISGNFNEAIARFYFHPEVEITDSPPLMEGSAILSGGQRLIWKIKNGIGDIYSAAWHPEFGRSLPNKCLQLSFTGPETEIIFNWN